MLDFDIILSRIGWAVDQAKETSDLWSFWTLTLTWLDKALSLCRDPLDLKIRRTHFHISKTMGFFMFFLCGNSYLIFGWDTLLQVSLCFPSNLWKYFSVERQYFVWSWPFSSFKSWVSAEFIFDDLPHGKFNALFGQYKSSSVLFYQLSRLFRWIKCIVRGYEGLGEKIGGLSKVGAVCEAIIANQFQYTPMFIYYSIVLLLH